MEFLSLTPNSEGNLLNLNGSKVETVVQAAQLGMDKERAMDDGPTRTMLAIAFLLIVVVSLPICATVRVYMVETPANKPRLILIGKCFDLLVS